MYNSRFIVIAITAIILESCKTTPPTSLSTTATEPTPEPVLVQLGDRAFTTKDFAASFEKNRYSLNAEKPLTPEEYLPLYTNMKLKVLAAEKEGTDTTQNFKDEINTYREILSQNFLTDKDIVEKFALEAYERSKTEVEASHILVRVPEFASPEDTLKAYQKIQAIWQQLKGGANFEELASTLSEDPSAKTNKGYLGVFTVFQMVYPFENAAYETPVGSISQPIRSMHGYHIVKVKDRRPNRGKIQVAHILVSVPANGSPEQQKAAENKINEAYQKLKAGEDWAGIVSTYSDDKRSAIAQGVLPPFGVGNMIKPFEDVAFSLTKPGDFSAPVQTSYGWHIVKLIQKLPTESYEDAAPALRQKVAADSRGRYIEKVNRERLKKQYTVIENADVLARVESLTDSTLLRGKWTIPNPIPEELANAQLFVLARNVYKANEFLDFLKARQRPVAPGSSVRVVVRKHFDDFINEKLVAYAKTQLEKDQPEFRQLMEEISDGVLLSNMMEKYVWGKSLSDSLGQVKIFEQNRGKYQYPERALASLVVAKDTAKLNRAKRMLASNPYKLELRGEELSFENNESTPGEDATPKLRRLVSLLSVNQSYIVEINGYRDERENADVSEARLNHVVDYLRSNGVPLTRIIEKNHGALRNSPSVAQNRKVTFVYYSSSVQDVMKVLNTNENAEEVIVRDGYINKDDSLLAGLEWKIGEQSHATPEGRKWINIKKIEAPRLKTFEEARGAVINDYQQILEKDWLEKLKSEYPAQINSSELSKVK